MGKSNKKSNVKVAAVTPTIPLVQGKKAKRQPESAVGIQPLHKKLKSATKVPQKKKHETSPSSEEASESEEEVILPVSKKPNLAKKIPAQGSSSEEEDLSDEEPATKLVSAAKKSPKLANNGSISAIRNGKAEPSDDSESDSEEEKPLQTKGAEKIGFFKGKLMEESSDDDDSEDEPSDEGSDSEESEEEITVQKVKYSVWFGIRIKM